MFAFLLVVQAIIAALLVTVILMQRSEGGGLTSGGSPGGLMSARGAANFLTRSTSVLAFLFVAMSITLAVVAASRGSDSIDTSLARPGAVAPAAVPQAGAPAVAPDANAAAPADEGAVPLAQ